MTTINGIPAHPLVIHAVVVLLPLAALGAITIAARAAWRRSLGIPVLLLALVGVAAVPVATRTGGELRTALGGGGPLVAVHEQRAGYLLPWAVAFLVVLAASVLLDWRARGTTEGTPPGTTALVRTTSVLAAVLGIVVTVLVVWIGDAGAQAVWGGVGARVGG